ncbi:MAG TPA: glycosyltransferase family 9 protein [Bryobacteraceae bacterium]|jgi:ADP-heptose:LPS heptosyltransferase
MKRLIIRPGAIGDCILSLPALEHLKTDYTELWVPSPVVPLIQFADEVRSISATGLDLLGIHGVDASAWLRTQIESFDEIVSWYGFARPDFRTALESFGVPCAFLPALPLSANLHATDFFAQSVGASSGLLPRLCVQPGERRIRAVIHPFSGGLRKNWPREFFRALAARLPLPVEWTAGPEETLPGATRFDNLFELAGWLAGAKLYIGNDSGVTHLAAATGMPTLALFGPTAPRQWAPRGGNVLVLHHEPLTELPVESVLDAANRLLGSP